MHSQSILTLFSIFSVRLSKSLPFLVLESEMVDFVLFLSLDLFLPVRLLGFFGPLSYRLEQLKFSLFNTFSLALRCEVNYLLELLSWASEILSRFKCQFRLPVKPCPKAKKGDYVPSSVWSKGYTMVCLPATLLPDFSTRHKVWLEGLFFSAPLLFLTCNPLLPLWEDSSLKHSLEFLLWWV